MSYGYIYRTINLKNGRFYIGQRKGEFCPKYLGSGIAIKRAIKKYRRDTFKVEYITSGSCRFELDWMERHLISEYRELGHRNLLYNISSGGTGGRDAGFRSPLKGTKRIGFIMSESARQRISIANKGRKLSEEHKRTLLLVNKGKPKSELHKQRMRENHANFKDSHHPHWNPNAKQHKYKKWFCSDCGVSVTRRALRCVPCRNREILRVRYGHPKPQKEVYGNDCF